MPFLLPLVAQTTYAEIIELCAHADFDAAFPPNGSFVATTVKGRRYWYYQSGSKDESGRQPKKYVGPDNEHTALIIGRHGAIKSSYRDRRAIVAALKRYGLPAPPDETGKILRGLADQGIFRLRACVIGTVAYPTYGGLLGVKLPAPAMQTGDLDLAQSRAISVAVAQDVQTPAFLDLLRGIDPTFRAVPSMQGPNIAANYINGASYRVEILTDNRGPDSDRPVLLPALRTHAQPLRFLDYLLYEAVPAVVLWDGGILVNVPKPERYAVHKLIVAQRRTATAAKRPKDLLQASALFDALAERRPSDLAAAWAEAYKHPKWKKLLCDALVELDSIGRDRLLYAVGETRSIIPSLDIEFRDPQPRYEFSRDVVMFNGYARNQQKECAITRAALDDWFDVEGKGQETYLKAFRDHREEIQGMAQHLYLNDNVPSDGAVLIKTLDVPRLRTQKQSRTSRPSGRRRGGSRLR
jgi:hypothetical protein